MSDRGHKQGGPWACFGALVLVLALPSGMAATLSDNGVVRQQVIGATVETLATAAPGVRGQIHRWITRSERSMERLGWTVAHIASVWSGILLSAAGFLLVAALSSVADVRMFGLRKQGPGALPRYLLRGTRTFFRLLRDRNTPHRARGLVIAGLLYWLVPWDLIADSSLLPGVVDDVVVAALAAKGFIHFCPDSLVARHAAAVQWRPRITRSA